MALAKKCDRCGCYYKQESILINKLKVNGIIIIDRETDNRSYSTRDIFDLCPTCLKSLNDWLFAKVGGKADEY